MKRIIAIMITLAFCLPARADILIFQTATSGQQIRVSDNIVESKKERGYLVIDADLSNPDAVVVNEAHHLHYELNEGEKIQYTTILTDDEVEIILIDFGNNKKMILRYFDVSEGIYETAYGTAKLTDIGGPVRYTARSLTGHSVWKQPDYKTGSGKIRLRLDVKATKEANEQSKTAIQLIESYEEMLQETKGYIPD